MTPGIDLAEVRRAQQSAFVIKRACRCECCKGIGEQAVRHPHMTFTRVVDCPQCGGSGLDTVKIERALTRVMRL